MATNEEEVSSGLREILGDAYDAADEIITSLTDGKNQQDQDTQEDLDKSRDSLSKYIFSSARSFEYPMRLGERQNGSLADQLHSIRFTILARENSRVAKLTNQNTLAAINFYGGNTEGAELEVVDRTDQNRLSADQARTISLLSGGIAGAALGLGIVGSSANLVGKGIGMAVGGAVAAGGAAAVIERVATVRTLGTINLYISQPPVAKYSANWENKELGALAGLGTQDGFTAENLLKGAKGVGELGIRGAIKAAANLPGQLGIGGDIGSSIDLASAKTANPYKEQLFTNMGFRQFAFTYKFTPRNDAEYKQVRTIIDLFKYHMHPENDPTGLFLEYPSEFEIEYLYEGEDNPHLSKISNCALTDMKVTYGNQDAFTTVKGQGGVPAEINVELAFTELETLTNNRIADGF